MPKSADFSRQQLEDIAQALRHYWHWQLQRGEEVSADRVDRLIARVDEMEGCDA